MGRPTQSTRVGQFYVGGDTKVQTAVKRLVRNDILAPAGEHGVDEIEDGAFAIYVEYLHDPKPLADAGLVDPLSLLASLRGDQDERVQQAAEQLESGMPW